MIPSELAEKLAKLLPMLGSDQDGEVANAARQIKKALANEKLDFHDLVHTISRRADRQSYKPQKGSDPFNFANAFREGTDASENTHPGAMTSRFGLPIHNESELHSWGSVAQYCIKMNKSIPKRYGGKFLLDWQLKMLSVIAEGVWPNNSNAKLIETILARCHQARDAQRAAETRTQ